METEELHNTPKMATKRMKLQEIMEKGEEDRISELPDCLLLEILSRLPSTKYAIRTGTLSKRWKHLWTMVPTLIFDHGYYGKHSWSDFASFVDKTLTQCRQLKLKKFQVNTRCNIRSGLQVNEWIWYAIRCNVEELNLTLWNTEDKFLLDQSFFTNTCVTDLTIEGYMFNPIRVIFWKNLRSLYITYGKLDEVVIEKILSGSPALETLVLDRCYGFRRLNITSKSVKNLVLDGFFGSRQHDILEIKAPDISSVTIKGRMWLKKLSLVNMPSLVEANLLNLWDVYGKMPFKEVEAEEEMLKGLILNLRHVKKLKIGGRYSKGRNEGEACKWLLNKELTVEINLNLPNALYLRSTGYLSFGG